MSDPAVDFRNFDFVDFGCGQGGSIEAAERMFGGRRGIGLDIDSRKVDAVRRAGYEARVCDVRKISSKTNSVRFVMMSHFLEHLPGRNDAVACIKSACNLSREFVFIQQPYFDADGYLFDMGLKSYWSDWRGHAYHMTSLDLFNCLRSLREKGVIHRFSIYGAKPVLSSLDDSIHPVSSAEDQHGWDPSIHDPKPSIEFSWKIYREIKALIGVDPGIAWGKLEKRFKWSRKLFDSDKILETGVRKHSEVSSV